MLFTRCSIFLTKISLKDRKLNTPHEFTPRHTLPLPNVGLKYDVVHVVYTENQKEENFQS